MTMDAKAMQTGRNEKMCQQVNGTFREKWAGNMNTIAKNKIIKDDVLARGSEIEGAQAINMTRPLLKWAGGKTQLLGEIIQSPPIRPLAR
jgi:conjugal transfer/entry exclusion protein